MTCRCKGCIYQEPDGSCKVLFDNVIVENEDSGITAVKIEPDEEFGCILGLEK